MAAAAADALPADAQDFEPGRAPRRRLFGFKGMNPMMYKELAQGARSGGFIALFFVLLAAGLLISLVAPLLASTGREAAGPYAFWMLALALHLYGVIVGVRSMTMTAKEIENKTFELYTLAGMTPERMVLGKAMTSLYIFFFGLSCLAPFMFASYFMRGLDFRTIYQTLLALAAIQAQYLLAMNMAGLLRSKTRHKVMVNLGSLAAVGAMFFYGIAAVSVCVEEASRGGMSGPNPPMFFASFGMFGWSAMALEWEFLAIFGLHAFLALATFYCGCHAVCPETDSREHSIKLLLCAFYTSLCFLIQWIPDSSALVFFSFVLWYGFLGFGLLFWVNQEQVPIMVRHRMERFWWPRRLAMSFVEPGRLGSFCCLVYMALAATLFSVARAMGQFAIPSSYSLFSSSSNEHLELVPLALPWVGFFLLAVTDMVLSLNSSQGSNPPLRRSTMLLVWGLLAVLAIVGSTLMFEGRHEDGFDPLMMVLGLFGTPFLTPFVLPDLFKEDQELAALLCATLGVAGMLIAAFDAARTRREQATRRGDVGPELLEALATISGVDPRTAPHVSAPPSAGLAEALSDPDAEPDAMASDIGDEDSAEDSAKPKADAETGSDAPRADADEEGSRA